ncbi:uncharacterized protein Tco025E_09599 [Trypanosoma conorhini]|uniref:Uncharacterized protein n=1 Tax=Trypanosoma conorhini TaxID=83891 RepID=A0A422MUQ3_9TRYP|nr:uncharacterized protein Tco025E_09599 [Trypanosoma conorhini]RNE96927.1 hypothetical protein Tco025E_09599 [Trypanosoma conorhini]
MTGARTHAVAASLLSFMPECVLWGGLVSGVSALAAPELVPAAAVAVCPPPLRRPAFAAPPAGAAGSLLRGTSLPATFGPLAVLSPNDRPSTGGREVGVTRSAGAAPGTPPRAPPPSPPKWEKAGALELRCATRPEGAGVCAPLGGGGTAVTACGQAAAAAGAEGSPEAQVAGGSFGPPATPVPTVEAETFRSFWNSTISPLSP